MSKVKKYECEDCKFFLDAWHTPLTDLSTAKIGWCEEAHMLELYPVDIEPPTWCPLRGQK